MKFTLIPLINIVAFIGCKKLYNATIDEVVNDIMKALECFPEDFSNYSAKYKLNFCNLV